MKKNEWVNNSFEERITWYRNQLSKLSELLSSDSDQQNKREEILKNLKMRMVFDNTPSDERPDQESEQARLYHRTIYKAYKALPDFDTKSKAWEQFTRQANKILSGWSS